MEDMMKNPSLFEVESSNQRLIDQGMLHFESSIAGYNERYHRGETSHTIHVWWARRPHSAMRSVVFASLCKQTDSEASDLMARLAMNLSSDDLSEAIDILSNDYANPPRVLDMFGGGGTIPFEAKRLGCDTYSIDANQLSVFIQKCNLLYSDKIDIKKASEAVFASGNNVLTKVKERTNWLYPLREKTNESTFGYLWSYATDCDACGYRFLLTKRRWLSKKNGKKTSFELRCEEDSQRAVITENCDDGFESNWNGRSSSYLCPKCGHVHERPNALDCEDVVLATISLNAGAGKTFSDIKTAEACPSKRKMIEEENLLLKSIGIDLPSSELPDWSGIVNPAPYGIKTHSDFVNGRQRLLLLYLIDELKNEFNRLKSIDEIQAKFVIGMLSSLIDQVVDWNCRLSMWIPQNEQVGRAFCGPGVAMYWDYAETDQLLSGPANLWSKLNRIVKGVSSMAELPGKIDIRHAIAQELPFENDFFDAIVTDPPYYDNIYYSILADFFYAWKKPLLEKIEPDLFKNEITDFDNELVASARRSGGSEQAYEDYCVQLKKAFSEASRVLKDDGIFSFVYSHASADAWMAVIESYRNTPFVISSVQPLSIERKGRPRAVTSKAVNTCVTIVARKIASFVRNPISFGELEVLAKEKAIPFGLYLCENLGWTAEDAGMAAMAIMVGAIGNSSMVSQCHSDKEAILRLAALMSEHFSGFKITDRTSL